MPGQGGDTDPAPRRVRVTSPRRDARLLGPRRTVSTEIDEQTGLGEVYMAALIRAQLRLSLSVLAAAFVMLGGLPVLFLALPVTRDIQIWRIPLPWLILGVAVYPVVAWGARYYVRHAEQIEREFLALVHPR